MVSGLISAINQYYCINYSWIHAIPGGILFMYLCYHNYRMKPAFNIDYSNYLKGYIAGAGMILFGIVNFIHYIENHGF